MDMDQIWEAHRSAIHAFLRSKISNPADVEDLQQEVMIKIYHHLDSVNTQEKIESWLFQIARNTVIDYYRKNGRKPDLKSEDLWYTEPESESDHVLSSCVMPFIKALPQTTAAMLIAIDIEGQSQKAYAKNQGMSYSTLKSRVQSARKQLKDLFTDCCHFSKDGRGKVIDFQQKHGHPHQND